MSTNQRWGHVSSEPSWEPYRPPWYPADAPDPFLTDPSTMQGGSRTYYSTWVDTLPPGELVRLINETRGVDRG
jgi:hypothetical protein